MGIDVGTLLRILFYCKTHRKRPPSQNPSEKPSPEPFPELFLERGVAIRPLDLLSVKPVPVSSTPDF